MNYHDCDHPENQCDCTIDSATENVIQANAVLPIDFPSAMTHISDQAPIPSSYSNGEPEKSHDPERQAVNKAALHNNAMVYSIAEKYELLELKKLAQLKFAARSANIDWTTLAAVDLVPLLREVYSFTLSATEACEISSLALAVNIAIT